jgi:hypothetical protein
MAAQILQGTPFFFWKQRAEPNRVGLVLAACLVLSKRSNQDTAESPFKDTYRSHRTNGPHLIHTGLTVTEPRVKLLDLWLEVNSCKKNLEKLNLHSYCAA